MVRAFAGSEDSGTSLPVFRKETRANNEGSKCPHGVRSRIAEVRYQLEKVGLSDKRHVTNMCVDS